MSTGAHHYTEAEKTVKREPVIVTEAIDYDGETVTVDCTWKGRPESAISDLRMGPSPWQHHNDIDPHGPVLVCDVHACEAHPCVYDSNQDDTGEYVGPCTRYDLPPEVIQ